MWVSGAQAVQARARRGQATQYSGTQAIQKKTAVIRFSSSVLPW